MVHSVVDVKINSQHN